MPKFEIDPNAADGDASEVDAIALVASRFEGDKQYNILAIRHNRLVDFVLDELRKQAKAKPVNP